MSCSIKALAGLLAIAVLAGCGGRYRAYSWSQGYKTQMLSNGSTLVRYADSDIEFAKEAAWYRAAELGAELGYDGFLLKSEQEVSQFESKPRSNSLTLQSMRNSGVDIESPGMVKTGVVGYSYTVEYLKNSRDSRVFSIQEILNTRPVPGTGQLKKNLEQKNGK